MSGRDRDMFAEWQRRFAEDDTDATPLIPAATVIVLRDGDAGLETLMLRRNSKLEFVGGMWVFPGGRIDAGDRTDDDPVASARRAAVREADEEAGQHIDADELVWFSHWTPPAITPKRFSTWFFAARGDDPVAIDGGEIHDADWMSPSSAMARRNKLEIELAPPTWVTLHNLAAFDTVDAALSGLNERPVDFFVTNIGRSDVGPVAMWEGDAGYVSGDAATNGPRHRLTMAKDGFLYDDSAKP